MLINRNVEVGELGSGERAYLCSVPTNHIDDVLLELFRDKPLLLLFPEGNEGVEGTEIPILISLWIMEPIVQHPFCSSILLLFPHPLPTISGELPSLFIGGEKPTMLMSHTHSHWMPHLLIFISCRKKVLHPRIVPTAANWWTSRFPYFSKTSELLFLWIRVLLEKNNNKS